MHTQKYSHTHTHTHTVSCCLLMCVCMYCVCMCVRSKQAGLIYNVILTSLTSSTRYYYRAGFCTSTTHTQTHTHINTPPYTLQPHTHNTNTNTHTTNDWTDEFSFVSAPKVGTLDLTIAYIADLGQEVLTPVNVSMTVNRLSNDVKSNVFDMLVHAGDIAYTGGVEVWFVCCLLFVVLCVCVCVWSVCVCVYIYMCVYGMCVCVCIEVCVVCVCMCM